MTSPDQISDALLDRALAAIEHEADMDGVAIITGVDLALMLGVSSDTARSAIRRLVGDGLVHEDGRMRHNIPILRLPDTG